MMTPQKIADLRSALTIIADARKALWNAEPFQRQSQLDTVDNAQKFLREAENLIIALIDREEEKPKAIGSPSPRR